MNWEPRRRHTRRSTNFTESSDTATWDPEGNIFVDTQYDAKGRKTQVSDPYRSGTPGVTVTSYDGLDRAVSVQHPDGTSIQYAFSNNTTVTTEEAGNQHQNIHHALGQLIEADEPNPTLSSPLRTTYQYYGFGPLYQVSQSGQTRTFAYDWLGGNRVKHCRNPARQLTPMMMTAGSRAGPMRGTSQPRSAMTPSADPRS